MVRKKEKNARIIFSKLSLNLVIDHVCYHVLQAVWNIHLNAWLVYFWKLYNVLKKY